MHVRQIIAIGSASHHHTAQNAVATMCLIAWQAARKAILAAQSARSHSQLPELSKDKTSQYLRLIHR